MPDPFEEYGVTSEFINSLGEIADDTLTSVEVICNGFLGFNGPERF